MNLINAVTVSFLQYSDDKTSIAYDSLHPVYHYNIRETLVR